MTMVAAAITISLDGYITGPNDGPGRGLGDGGERLHYWVFGGPWSYEAEPSGEATGADKEYLDGAMARAGADRRRTGDVRGRGGVGRSEPVRRAALRRHPPARRTLRARAASRSWTAWTRRSPGRARRRAARTYPSEGART